ncbi:Retrovirus-related Pol polyprotein from transposon [Trichinella spiralis]|uniref:Retrovirus-related Pol polyprotein from transposon n=1 Tax=Trichinella spiralis TaxID=6334 RepID=A0A0V1BDP8_TRISP|nr:Retrovirus-related Pol polyprotein from transposon [Trichinella spiralis]
MLDVARVAANVICTSRPPELSTKRSHLKPKSEISDSAMNYARRRALQSTCPTSVMAAVISSAPSHMACQSAFDALKYHLTSTPILAYPEFNCQFTVDVDVRGDGLGAVLSQRKGKTERVVAFAFRTLTKAERQYCTTQKEMLSLVWGLREFRPYLYGQRFLVRTDHSCLRCLAELDFELEHRAGRLHGNADALSRASSTQCKRQGPVGGHPAGRPTDLTSAAVVGWRELASRMSPRVQSRHARAVAQRRSWADADGFIWRHSRGLTAEEGAKQMLLPPPGRMADIGASENLILVARNERRRARIVAMTAGYPLQRIGVDILGPLESTPSGNQYDLVLTNYFTKWMAAFPLTNMETSTVAMVLVEKYIAYFGALDYLHSDQGRHDPLNNHPQGNEHAERFNRTLFDMLSIIVDGNPHQWDDMLPFVMLACNSSVHESTGVTPAIAMFCRELRLPLYVQIGNPPEQETQGLPEYIRVTRERIDRVHELVRDHLKTQQRRQKCLYDRHANETRFCLNDSVGLAVPRRQKLDRDWEGPYLIVEVMGSQTYRVRHQEQKRCSLVVHSARMKRYHARESAGDRSF